jgi:hypothetical protein
MGKDLYNMLKRLPSLTIILGNIVVLAGLALLAYLGFYNRYWADDWCYSADARTLGIIPATMQYFDTEKTGYSSNRYSLTFFSALTENTLGMFGNKIVATVTIILWLIGLVWIARNISRLIQPFPKNAILLGAGLLLFYNLYLSPQRFQILYWRSGVLPYSTAVIFWLFILGLITRQMTRETPSKWTNYVVAPLAFLTAGLGEISCVYLFSGTTLLLLVSWVAKQKGYAWAEKSFQTTLIAWLFLLLGMITLIVSPSNVRLENMDAKQSAPLLVPIISLRNALGFIVDTGRSLPIPLAIFTISIFALAVLSAEPKSNIAFTRILLIIFISAVITYLLIVAIQAPSAYFYSAPPDPRGQSLSRFTLQVGTAVIAWIAGSWIAGKLSGNWLTIASAVVLLAGLAYTARSISTIYAELPGFIYRAQIWDKRDAIVEYAKVQGIMQVKVPVIDTAQIHTRDIFGSRGKGMEEFSENCAARYYGVDGLKADLP